MEPGPQATVHSGFVTHKPRGSRKIRKITRNFRDHLLPHRKENNLEDMVSENPRLGYLSKSGIQPLDFWEDAVAILPEYLGPWQQQMPEETVLMLATLPSP
ncbi:hypothetical protein DPEC_G00180840 [Dallia pectoralis]|uniref:Uncharacterized protein n=1 Tax=Dallia pectoralis TaxID=75939 RepID=A0ACC2GAD9_DALPE|nr:hypothetical protein DPEC_G00180840 [Dallia pectoralis]